MVGIPVETPSANIAAFEAMRSALGIVSVTERRAGKILRPYLGLVATRGRAAQAYSASFKEANSRTVHVARDDISSIQVVWGSFYLAPSTTDLSSGATTSLTCSVEYPIGSTPQRIQWGGQNTLTASDRSFNVSDALALSTSIPRGAAFIVRFFYSNPNGLMYYPYGSAAAGDGQSFYAGTGNTDQTLNSAFSLAAAGNCIMPLAILGTTQRPSIGIYGDSMAAGASEAAGGSTNDFDVGIIERWVGPNFAYSNLAQPGTRADTWSDSGAALRRLMLPYFSDVIFNFGANDFIQYGAANWKTYLNANAATVRAASGPIKRVWQTTTPPRPTSSTDSWATLVNQTIDATANPRRISAMADLRNGVITGVDGYFEVGDQYEPTRDSGQFIVSGSPNGYTSDGTHGNAAAYRLGCKPTILEALQKLGR